MVTSKGILRVRSSRIRLCLIGFTLLMAHAGRAQVSDQQITLAEAVQLFSQHNLELNLARSNADEWAARARQAAAYPNPAVEFTHEPLFRDGETSSETYFNLNQPIEWPGLRKARIDAARQLVLSAVARFQADSLQLVFEVARTYVEAVAAEAQYQHVLQVVTIFRDADAAAEARFAQGEMSAYRMRRLRVERARYENRLALAELERQRLQRRLSILLLPEDAGTRLIPSASLDQPPPPPPVETLLVQARAERPELIESMADVEAARFSLTEIQKDVTPAPVLTAGYKRQSNGFDGLFLGALLDLPVFDRKRGAIDAQSTRLHQAQTRLILAERHVELEVRQAFDTYASLYDRLELMAGDLLDEADQLLDAAQVSYSEGEMSLVELLDAAEAFFDARQTTTSLLSNTVVAYYDLMRSTGHIPVN